MKMSVAVSAKAARHDSLLGRSSATPRSTRSKSRIR